MPAHNANVILLGPFSHQATIEMFPDNVLLNIFLHFLDGSSQLWRTIVHVSERWRQIIATSPLGLELGVLHPTSGTTVIKTLESWYHLPLVVTYEGSPMLVPPAPDNKDNIVAKITQSGRISSISLTITGSLQANFSTIRKRPLELGDHAEDPIPLSKDSVQLTLHNYFRRHTRLRTLHLALVVNPSILQCISSSRHLVDFQLHLYDVSSVENLSPEAFVNAFSQTPQLQFLSLHLPSATFVVPPSSVERVTLPALTYLNLRGLTGYVEDLTARIDAPTLKNIEITFFDKNGFSVPNLRKFIDRIEMQKSHRRADILSSGHATSISLTTPEASCSLKLQVFCKTLYMQPLLMAEICTYLSAFLFRVEDLRISTMRQSSKHDGRTYEPWLRVIRQFEHIKWLHAFGERPTDVVVAVCALLQLSNKRRKPALPAMHKFCIREPEPRCTLLREAVVSCMHSRWSSGHFISVAYERLPLYHGLSGKGIAHSAYHHSTLTYVRAGPCSHEPTIEILSDDILLNIFLHFLDLSSHFWPSLIHVTRRWRQIILASPLSLDLRLYCTYGTPVLETLDCWPSLPLVVNYGGTPTLEPPAPEDDDNILAALKQSDRVRTISLTVTTSLLDKLSAITEPFSVLEQLILLSRDNMQKSLPNAFRWGPRLCSLYATRIAFPSLPTLLLPSQQIMDLQLHEIPIAGYFSPEAFADALSGMTQLRKISLHFISLPPRRNYLRLPPPGERVILPALTCFKYRGTSKYLDNFVARIDAPSLVDFNITFFSQPTMDAVQLGRFIDRIGVLQPNSRANIRISKHAISICFTRPGFPVQLELRVSCKHLDWQLSSMAQICSKFSLFLSLVEDLDIETKNPPTVQGDIDSRQWSALIRSFRGAKDFRVTGELATTIFQALGQERTIAMLPSFRDLCVPELRSAYGSLWEAVSSFTSSWCPPGRSGHVSQPSVAFPVTCRNEGTSGMQQTFFCGICGSSFEERECLSFHSSEYHWL